jgi:hypothetical protein
MLLKRLERGISLEESLTGEPPPKKPRADAAPGTERTLTVNGQTRRMSEWASRLGISTDALAKRLAAGWDHEEAVSTAKLKTNRARALRYAIRAGEPGSWSWYEQPFERDAYAQEFVTLHPDGASMEDVGAVMGILCSWVCEIEQGALKKLRKLLDDGEITEAELLAAMGVLVDHAPDGWDGERVVKPVKRERGAEGTDDEPMRTAGEPRVERWQDVPEVREDDYGEGR